MSPSFARSISLAVLLAFVASLGSWMFNVGRLAHELDDQIASLATLADSPHACPHHLVDRSPPADDSDHGLLHASAHIQPCPFLEFHWPVTVPSNADRGSFVFPAVAIALRETPFRPPRTFSSLA